MLLCGSNFPHWQGRFLLRTFWFQPTSWFRYQHLSCSVFFTVGLRSVCCHLPKACPGPHSSAEQRPAAGTVTEDPVYIWWTLCLSAMLLSSTLPGCPKVCCPFFLCSPPLAVSLLLFTILAFPWSLKYLHFFWHLPSLLFFAFTSKNSGPVSLAKSDLVHYSKFSLAPEGKTEPFL